MKTCKGCNQMNPDNAKYCEFCGGSEFIIKGNYTRVNLDEIKPINRFIVCPRCGEETSSAAPNCQYCGAALNKPDSQTENNVINDTEVVPTKSAADTTGSPIDTATPVQPDNNSSDPIPSKRKIKSTWKKKLILSGCFIAVFFAGFGIGKINTVNESTFYELGDYCESLLSKNKQYEEQISKYEEIIEPYKQLSDAEIAEKTAAANLKAKQDEEALAAKKAADEKAAADKAAADKAAADKAAAEQAAETAKGYETGITYDQLARTPDNYVEKKVKFKGKVLQVIEGDTDTQIRLAVNNNYDNVLYCVIPKRLTSNTRILKDDIITVFGVSKGLLSYQSTMGGQITIPSISVDDWGPN